MGKRLSYQEIFSIMDEIANKKLSPVLTTYFAAAGFKEGFDNEELYHLTRAMVATDRTFISRVLLQTNIRPEESPVRGRP